MSCCQDHTHASVTIAPAKPASSKSGCQCEQCRDADTCCDLLCFERPNYFCGHLLTDADLLREQTYFREKNKLYHRSFHGHGIVCGLRIMCDCECEGYVRIEQGYAIDDCGNDLVVCNPLRFNVIKALRDKGWLVDEAKPDPCEPKKPDDECHTRQCFYVAACYHEEPADFTAPFVPGCKPKLADCEPTRIHEMVTFDVLNELPPKAVPLSGLKKRIEACFDLFCTGQFAQYLQQHADQIEAILTGQAVAVRYDCRQLFCDLRGLLLLYLKKHPDYYNCTLEAEIHAIPLPEHAAKNHQADIKKQQPQIEYTDRCREAICKLIDLAARHVYTCVLNEFVPYCPQPVKASCVVLGTIEVERGEIIEICNCPRDYVWSFANFFEVLAATLHADQLCEDKTESDEDKQDPCGCKGRHVCCKKIDIKCEEILSDLRINPEALRYRGTAAFEAVASLRSALAAAFDFTRTDAYAPAMFTQLGIGQAIGAARKLGITPIQVPAPLAAPAVAPFDMLRRIGLATTNEPLVLAVDQGRVTASYAEVPVVPAGAPQVAEELNGLRDRIAKLEEQINRRTAPRTSDAPTTPKGGRGPKKRGPK